MLTFVRNSDLVCNHKDCDKQNNNLCNLEYLSHKENSHHAWRNGRYKTKKKVSQFTKSNIFIRTFDSVNEASRKTKSNLGNISSCCNGRRKTAGGYKWKFC